MSNARKFTAMHSAYNALKRDASSRAFFLTWAVILLYQYILGPTYYPFDSGIYWSLSSPEKLLDFPPSHRGYFFPATIAPTHYFAELLNVPPLRVFQVYSSAFAAFVLAIAFPSFFIMVFGGRISTIRRLCFSLFLIVIFPGVLVYPLSDFPAFGLLVTAGWLIVDSMRNDREIRRTLLQYVCAGVLAYGAYNTRTIYFFSTLVLPFIIFLDRRHQYVVRILSVLALIVGMGLAAIPQSIINYRYDGTYSPLLAAQTSQKSLFAQQLIWGISLQRYATQFDPHTNKGKGVYSPDPAGMRLFDKLKLTEEDATLARYLQIVLENPHHFLSIYTRHFINGLDVRDGDVYIQKLGNERNFRSLLSFILCYLAAYTLYLTYIRKIDSPHLNQTANLGAADYWPIWLCLLLLPVFMITPGAVETRFFLPLHILVYAVIAFRSRLETIKAHFSSSVLPGLAMLAFFLAFNMITSESIRLQQQQGIEGKYMLRSISSH